MSNLVVYSVRDEVLITTVENEAKFLAEFFTEETGRNVDEYEREESGYAFTLTPSIDIMLRKYKR